MIFVVCKSCTYGMTMSELTQNVCLADMKIKIHGSFAVSSANDFVQLYTKQNIYYIFMYLFTLFYVERERIQGIHTSKKIQ